MKTVLVVDDFASVRFYHVTLLRTAGFNPLAAANGAEALALITKNPVDLVMLDLVMPTMNGRDFVKRLRALPRGAAIPVVIITSETEPSELDDLTADAKCSVLTKPLLPATLLQELRRWLA